MTLHSYSGECIPVVGSVDVSINYKGKAITLPLVIMRGVGPSLLGRNWLQNVQFDWQEVFWSHNVALTKLLEKYNTVFSEELGTVKGFRAKIHVEPQVSPKFSKARSVPYFYWEKVEQELNHLVQEGILQSVEHSEWASPIVAVLKKDWKGVQICGDFKHTINPVSKLDRYPIPKIQDLFSQLSGGKSFTKLNLSQAYVQIPLEEESKNLVVINTHKGLFRYTRMPYGVSSAPGIFQRFIESVLQGIPKLTVYIDDILITGSTEEEHLQNLSEVLT